MCKVQMLRALVSRRLSAAVEEIFVVFERAIAELEEELSRAKEENEHQRQLLDAVFKTPEDVLHKPDVGEEHLPPEQEVKQQEPQPPHIKEEEEDHSIGQEGEHPEGAEEFPVIVVVSVKSEDDEDKGQSEENREAELPSASSLQHITEPNGDQSGGSQAESLFAPLSESDDTTSHSPDTDDEDSEDDVTCPSNNTHFKCSHCDKTFNHRCYLKIHMRYHTGEKPFVCSVCGKRFTEKKVLTIHTRIHTGEKPFICSVCGKRFTEKGSLTKHTRIHTGEKPFTCSVCGKGFAHNQNLTIHMRNHTGEKPFMCSVCGNRFIQKGNLKAHIRIHTGEKPFTCSVCGKSFTQKVNLTKHAKTHTGRNHSNAQFAVKDSQPNEN
uniref:gastrula zinc finger protein XlCGF52.1-like n=1 Tax=Doryrhamphus excisus TaxID=161450 RepID=UPI0025AE2827|nr:gastrula zinc finger protein XlCGF52.1-like [Doryrhamphus excisus]